jgi:hypothetical protein
LRPHHIALEVVFNPVAGEHILSLGQSGVTAHDDLGTRDIVFHPLAGAENFRFVGGGPVAQIDWFAGSLHALKAAILDVNGRHVSGQAHGTLS